MHQPVIGAINGAAIGGGFCLACACDIRIASEAAYFRAAGINNGLTASELGISYLLPREIGSARAFDIMSTGRDVDATEAERIGLRVPCRPAGDKLLDECYGVAERMIGFSRVGVEVTKRMLWSSLDAGELARAHGPRGHRAALRAPHDAELRRGDPRPQGEAHPRLPRLAVVRE